METIPEDLHRKYEEYKSDGLARLPEAVAKTSAAYDFVRDEYGEHEATLLMRIRCSTPDGEPDVDHFLRKSKNRASCAAGRRWEKVPPQVFYAFDFPGFDQDKPVLNFLHFCEEVLGANLDNAECRIAEPVGY